MRQPPTHWREGSEAGFLRYFLNHPSHLSRITPKAASEKIRAICDAYGFEVDPNQKIYDMSVSQK